MGKFVSLLIIFVFSLLSVDVDLSLADLPEPVEGSDEQPDPVPLMDRSCNSNILEKVLEYLTKHHEFDKTGASQVIHSGSPHSCTCNLLFPPSMFSV